MVYDLGHIKFKFIKLQIDTTSTCEDTATSWDWGASVRLLWANPKQFFECQPDRAGLNFGLGFG